MKKAKKYTRESIRQLADEITQFLVDHELHYDVQIYYNGLVRKLTDREPYYTEEERDVFSYVEYVPDKHILSMVFEGPFYELMNGDWFSDTLIDQFNEILEKYGLWYEQGMAFNLSTYPNGDIEEYEYLVS